ncbi:SDR family NAD(P)-dependent oxidoreductase [Pseudomonas sp. D(2018)]|uniref:SDR family NAD(P)-dependent oxidoreductase n=1 Tax=Pseudomonas sp. D(2018) TaxID=2502238 RepID=UPI0010F60461|nr:SDR family oxidoreductase [Pseudomonas sp. D(2018)]
MKTAFVTGVSRGFGKAMASRLLAEGFRVFGCSRGRPEQLLREKRFHWCRIDLSRIEDVDSLLNEFLRSHNCTGFDLVVLNAGLFGPSPRPATSMPLNELEYVLNVNLLANKVVLDRLLTSYQVDQCLVSASIAGVRLRAGTLCYGVSKAALNALCQIYALEHPATFFAVLGLCNLETGLLRAALGGPHVDGFPEIAALRDRASSSDYVVPVERRVDQVWTLYSDGFAGRLTSGQFQEVRSLVG